MLTGRKSDRTEISEGTTSVCGMSANLNAVNPEHVVVVHGGIEGVGASRSDVDEPLPHGGFVYILGKARHWDNRMKTTIVRHIDVRIRPGENTGVCENLAASETIAVVAQVSAVEVEGIEALNTGIDGGIGGVAQLHRASPKNKAKRLGGEPCLGVRGKTSQDQRARSCLRDGASDAAVIEGTEVDEGPATAVVGNAEGGIASQRGRGEVQRISCVRVVERSLADRHCRGADTEGAETLRDAVASGGAAQPDVARVVAKHQVVIEGGGGVLGQLKHTIATGTEVDDAGIRHGGKSIGRAQLQGAEV